MTSIERSGFDQHRTINLNNNISQISKRFSLQTNSHNDFQSVTFNIRKIFLFDIKRKYKAIFGTIVFVCVSIIVGVSTVYFTSSKSNELCERTFKQTVQNIISYNSRPQSVAVADFNNDTQLDFVIANTGIDNIDVYLGYGNGMFGNQTFYSMGYNSRPNFLSLGNFNEDNWIDIAIANYGANYVEIILKIC